jgi:hypothetical protein
VIKHSLNSDVHINVQHHNNHKCCALQVTTHDLFLAAVPDHADHELMQLNPQLTAVKSSLPCFSRGSGRTCAARTLYRQHVALMVMIHYNGLVMPCCYVPYHPC